MRFVNLVALFVMCGPRAHACRVRDDRGARGMERNIGEQLNKAFEAYRQASIEKDGAKRELQQKV